MRAGVCARGMYDVLQRCSDANGPEVRGAVEVGATVLERTGSFPSDATENGGEGECECIRAIHVSY